MFPYCATQELPLCCKVFIQKKLDFSWIICSARYIVALKESIACTWAKPGLFVLLIFLEFVAKVLEENTADDRHSAVTMGIIASCLKLFSQ